MDQIQIGKFISALRRQEGLTQEELGERLGVTNKTVSRWENGNYMPDIEMMQLLSKELHVSINELLAGERIPDEEFRRKADENILSMAKSSAFSFEERKRYFKRKWRREHWLFLGVLLLIFVLALTLPYAIERPWLAGLAPLIGILEYLFQNNRMMIYVESNLYD